jgi:hypothetical protein
LRDGEERYEASDPEDLARALWGVVVALRRGGTATQRMRALADAARRLAASGHAFVELCGGRVRGKEHTWLQAGDWWADPAGSALWEDVPAAGRLPHPLAGRPQWREPWRGGRCRDTGSTYS